MRGSSRPSRTGRATPEALQASFGSHSESAFFDDRCAQRVLELCPERGQMSALVKQADRGKFGEERDHGLSNVHRGLARPMMVLSCIGPK
jgi:hypothetical protein